MEKEKVSDQQFEKRWKNYVKEITRMGHAFDNLEDVEELKDKRDELLEMVEKAKKQRGDN